MLNYQRKLNTISFSGANEKRSFDLPRTALMRSLLLKISGVVTIGTAAATSLTDEAVKNFVSNIEVVGNGKEQIKSIKGADCFDLSLYDYGVLPEKTEPGLTVAAHSFECFYPINFACVDSKNKADTYLDGRLYSSLECRITLGSASDMLTPAGTTTFALSSLSAEIYVREAIKGEGNFAVNKESTLSQIIAATNSAEQVKLTVGNRLKRLFIKTLDVADPQNDIITNVIIKSGSNVFVDAPWDYFRQQNKIDYRIASLPDGIIVVDFLTDGLKSESLPTEGMNQLDMILAVTKGTGATTVRVVSQEIM